MIYKLLLRGTIVVVVLEVGVLVASAGRRRLLPRILGRRVLRQLMRGIHMHVLHALRNHFNYGLSLCKTLELLNKALVHLRKVQFLLAVRHVL